MALPASDPPPSAGNRFRWREITRQQWTVFAVATVGYGLYYVCRLSLSVVKAPLIASGVLTEAQVGFMGSALFYVYAFGKFANGFFADRISLRRLLSVGLLLSAAANLALGSSGQFALFVALWGLNGWAQSMGAPACVVGLTRWFAQRQRGTFYGLWSASHNIGEGLTFIVTSLVVSVWGWRAGFLASGTAGLIGVGLIWILFLDRAPAERPVAERPKSRAGFVTDEQWKVLRSPLVWTIALASACMYVTRYAVNSWGVFFYQHAKGYTPVEAGSLVAVSSVCGVIGTVSSGWLSDILFRGDRFKPTLLFGVVNLASLALMLWAPRGHVFLDMTAMVGFGLGIGSLVCYLGGLIAVDSVSKEAAGAALGVVGVASYLGAGAQDALSGWLIGHGRTNGVAGATYDFSLAGASWLVAAFATVAFTVWGRQLHVRAASRIPPSLAPAGSAL